MLGFRLLCLANFGQNAVIGLFRSLVEMARVFRPFSLLSHPLIYGAICRRR